MIQKIRLVCWPSESSTDTAFFAVAGTEADGVEVLVVAESGWEVDALVALADGLTWPGDVFGFLALRQFWADAPAVHPNANKIAETILPAEKIRALSILLTLLAIRLAAFIIN